MDATFGTPTTGTTFDTTPAQPPVTRSAHTRLGTRSASGVSAAARTRPFTQ